MPSKVKPKTDRKIRTTTLRRVAFFDRQSVDMDARTVNLAFSSEVPVARWFGEEILDHGKGSVRMKRLRETGPLLLNHDGREHIGTVESAKIDSDRVGRAVVRFGQGADRDAILQDIEDGIRKSVSVGYQIHRMKLEESSDDEPDVYRATDWEPFEISLVSMPADIGVGVGREAREWHNGDEGHHNTITIDLPVKETKTMKFDANGNPIAETDEDRDAITAGTAKRKDGTLFVAAAAPVPVIAAVADPVNVDEVRAAEQLRIKLMTEVGAKYGQVDLATKCIAENKSLAEFNAMLLDALPGAKRYTAETRSDSDVNIGLDGKEIKRFQFLRLIRARTYGHDQPSFVEEAAFELEVCRVAGEEAKKGNRKQRGLIIPNDILLYQNHDASRDWRTVRAIQELMQTRVLTQAVAGASTIAEDLLAGSFIDLLRNRMIVAALGATMLNGLDGDVAIPRLTGGGTAFWLATDETDITEATQTLDQVTLVPRNVGALSVFTRQLLLQSSVAIEALVRSDIATVLAIAVDLAALYGTGAGGQPTGVSNTAGIGAPGAFAAAVPTFAEVISLETVVAQANALTASLAYAVDTGMRGSLKSAEKVATTGQFIWEVGNTLNGHRTEVSNQITDGDVFFGNWSDLLQGSWGGLDVLIDPYTLSARGNTRVIAFWTTDFAVRHPESFSFENDT
jgi:HK97 family phage major capsid protein